MHYKVNEPIFIYRIHTGNGQKTYKSVITSYATISDIIEIKTQNRYLKSCNEYMELAGNKTVFSESELINLYETKKNLVMISMVYNGFFGRGNNVTHNLLSRNGLFNSHPYQIDYTRDEFIRILEMGKKDVQTIIIN